MKPIYILLGAILVSHQLSAQHVTGNQHCELGSFDHSGSVEMILDHRPEIALVARSYYAPHIQFRGFTDRRMAFSIDGMHLTSANPYFTDPITSYFEMTNLSSVDMDLSDNGPAFAGIGDGLDIKLRPAFLEHKQSIAHKLEIFGQSNGLGEGLRFSRDFSSEKMGYFISVSSNNAHSFYDGSGSEVARTQFEERNVYGAGVWQVGHRGRLKASFVLDVAHDLGFYASPVDVDRSSGSIGALSYVHQFDSSSAWQFFESKFYGHSFSQEFSQHESYSDSLSFTGKGSSKTLGLNLKAERRRGNAKTSLRLSTWADEVESFEDGVIASEEGDVHHLWPLATTYGANLYVRERIRLDQRSILVLTGSLQRLQMHASSVMISRSTPNLGLFFQWKVNRDWTIMPKVDYKERALTQHEAFASYVLDEKNGFEYVGNPNLKNESSIQFELTGLRKSEASMLKMDAFYWVIHNFISGVDAVEVDPRRSTSLGVRQYQSIGEGKMLGLEVEFDKEIGNHWGVHGSLSGLYSMDEHGHPLPNIPAEELVLGGEWHNERNVVSWIWHTQYQKDHVLPQDGELRTGTYSVLDLVYDFVLSSNESIEVSGVVEVDNIFDSYYVPFLNYGGFANPGRNIRLSLHLEF